MVETENHTQASRKGCAVQCWTPSHGFYFSNIPRVSF